MKRNLVLVAMLLIAQFAAAQVKVIHLKKADIPTDMKYKGGFRDAVQYTDKDGTHTVITTEAMLSSPSDDNESVYTGYLHAFNYLQTGNTVTLVWQMNDLAGPCGPDQDTRFHAGSLDVTDLDKNGVCEVWLVYRVSCHGYQTPSPMKVIMHEGVKKYAMRGTTKLKLKVTPPQYMGGDYTFDAAFDTAPESFRAYAKQLWGKNLNEVAKY
ncbi:MAG TPA: hypothetical protein VL442_11015 [Mucilaginibacter sp.]|jgi:hypothetical protein|nr:hypothetical protein [Mucilaginibacter sp.]